MQRKRVLFVDDDEAVLRLFKRMLEQKGGYEVALEQNAKCVLQRARDFHPQIIFLDITMPDAEGSTVAMEIRSDPAFSKVPIVFLTGAVNSEEVEGSGGKIGGEYFLAKPIELNALVNRIESCIGPGGVS